MSETNMSLRKRVNTRARLVEAATVVFAEKGFAGARIDDVVHQAGFTRGAFYSNYSSMQELLREVIAAHAATLLQHAEIALGSIEGTPDVDAIMELLDALRPEGRTLYILTAEYRLYRLRYPEEGAFQEARREFGRTLAKLVSTVLLRMGRKSTLSDDTLADVVAVFYLDSIASHYLEREDDAGLLRQVVEAIVLGLSEPIGQ
ncbi:TetR/AcrR family transcriptional regulator [Actinobaculum sp. 352]|uniref:TetR/AcrR family transcriptional regulator n=1 Tax=Actinobaculum sp. 352 TaxID=2490946 RepID=UPI000F7DDC93|nr:TetR/AcrR family transcriptional regulator [Actinobaculum sp. 352]RTE49557.1 TetR/AcrR family transcriptional regulator [Actinobaculum sp. 352]